jgi:hypothetical protein
MWLGFWANVASGVLLLIAYPTKAFTDPVFYLKLGFIAAGIVALRFIRKRVFGRGNSPQASQDVGGKGLAVVSLICWAGAIAAGKFIEYTYTYLTYPV